MPPAQAASIMPPAQAASIMPPAQAASKKRKPQQNIFHQKKKPLPEKRPASNPSRSASPQKPTLPAKPSPATSVEPSALPDGPYTEFKLVSSALNGWKYDVMKFDSHKPVDILKWTGPVKLNRKDLGKSYAAESGEGEVVKAVGPMLGPDGKPVIGMDGRIVMVDAEGKPIHGDSMASGSGQGKAGGGGKKKLTHKTRQIHVQPEELRQLRKEERYPWVMEDSTGMEMWVGRLEDSARANTNAFFMPASNNTFKFVPAHRWYKFQKRPNYRIPNLEEAESVMALREKNKDPARWLLRNRNGQAPSASTSAILKAETTEDGSGQSYGPGGRRLRAVARSSSIFGDDDEDGGRRSRRDLGADADFDEVPYEEDFADDEEQADLLPEADEELQKDMEERIRREYMSANKQTDGTIDADEDEDLKEIERLTNSGKAIKKIVKKHDNQYDDSDDEVNPYASSEEEEEEEETVIADGPAVQPHMSVKQPPRAPSQAPSAQTAATPAARPVATSTPTSRAASPAANHGGHSIVAKRATSPNAPKPKPLGSGVRAISPLAQVTTVPPTASADSRAVSSPSSSRATPSNGTTPAGAHLKRSGTKRKADDEAVPASGETAEAPNAGQPKQKKRKAAPPALDADGNPIYFTTQMVLDWLHSTPQANTRDCILHFTPYLHNDEEKTKFTALIKQVAQLKGGVLTLRGAYRQGGKAGADSPEP
ncbi:hypothetical protein FA95DRAFT_1561259 [Auriscalpium vulgare]|uniref:Uncharacterized protein n=1 Tax=Auriscalpium vulgare TaxID=40419 RepID=A0ACB8RNE0_9AGAM|nr:hypothetical protein FA95DRAFT_1561259 [Auriscalpium vulgare]